GGIHLVGHVFARQGGERVGGGDLHRIIDCAGAYVERAAEDIREAEDIIDLVGIVRAAGGDDGVGTHLTYFLRGDFRIGIGHGEDDRLVRHRLDHLLGHLTLGRQAEEDVGSLHRFGQRAGFGRRRVRRLPLVHGFSAALIDHALGVAQDDLLAGQAHALEQFDAGDRRGAGAVDHQRDVLQLSSGEMQRVDQAGGGYDRRAVLVVMEDGDVEQLTQALFNDETFRRLDVFEIDAAEGLADITYAIDELVDVLGIDFDVEGIDVGKALEQASFAFHDRLGGQGADIAEAEHGSAIGDHGDHVAFGRVVVSELGVLGDMQAG